MNIDYICEWGKYKEKAWSGTTYSLFKALSKENEVNDINIKLSNYKKILLKNSSINISKLKKYNENFSLLRNFFYKTYDYRFSKDADATIEIGDFTSSAKNYYVYQDLSIDSLIYYNKYNSEKFIYSGFNDIPLKRLINRKKYQDEIYLKAKGIFVMGNWLKENLIKYSNINEEKIHVVGAGINLEINNIKPEIKKGNKILFVGRDFFRKGGDLTYKAFKILREKYISNAELYVIGPSKWQLDECIEGVNFIGDISSDKLSYYYNICDIFCLPSRFEAYGIAFIEALVYGLPCIARNDFEMKYLINNNYNGVLIENDDEEILAEKMYTLLNNKIIFNNVLQSRKKYIYHYSWDTVAKKMTAIIKSKS